MKVLLLKDVPNVGRKNDVKDVNDGFARNFLFARKLAVPATHERIKEVENNKQGKEQKHASEQKKYQDMADRLKTIEVAIATKVGEKGRAFGSVGKHEIKKAIEKQGIVLEDEWIVLEEPIKSTGEKQIAVAFPHGISGSVKITIKPQ